jgi:hypothetical protein
MQAPVAESVNKTAARKAASGPLVLYLCFVAAVVVCVSSFGWTRTWSTMFVPSMYPPFADMRVFQGAVISAERGLDPQASNPGDPWQRRLNQPRYWVGIAELLDLQDEARFRLVCTILIACFVGICAFILYRYPSYGLLACSISTATLLGVERANSDVLIFCLVFLYALLLPRALSPIPILVATALKLYPVFALAALVARRQFKPLAASSFAALLIFAYLFDQLGTIQSATQKGYRLAYGLPSLALYFERIDMPWVLAGAMIAAFLAVLILTVYFRRLKDFHDQDGFAANLFLCGASIYVGTFIVATNWDYRLMFLIPCIPHLQSTARPLARILVALILIAMNASLLLWFFGKAGMAVNWSAKVAVFIVLCAWLITRGLAAITPRHAATGPVETAAGASP